MNVKNWSFSYKGIGKQEVKQHILDTLSLWGAIGLLWYSFLSIIKEHFPEFIEVTVEAELNQDKITTGFGETLTLVTYGMDWLVIGMFLLVLWLAYDWPKKYLKRYALPCHLAGVAIPIAYVGMNFERVADGVVRLAYFYLPKWNSYYNQNLSLGLASKNENSVVAFTAICMILWWLVWALAYALKRRILLVLFPVLALSLELLVGESPVENGLFFAVYAGILLMTLGGTSVWRKAVALVCVGLGLSLSGSIFEENIKELATEQKKQEILEWQNSFDIKEFQLEKLFQIDFHFNWEKLGNNAPQFTGKTVLEIESTSQPLSTVYIKGFFGTNYDGGNWSYDDSAFKNACREAGKSAKEVAQQIFQMPYDRWTEYYADHKKSEITYIINYTGTTGDVAYVPYVSDYASLDEEYTFMGDYLLKKSILDKSITATSINKGLEDWWSVNNGIQKGFGTYQDSSYSSYLTPEIDLTDQIETLEFLNGLSDAYLQVPKDAQEFLSQATAEIEKQLEIKETADNSVGYYYSASDNYRRMRYGETVASYLASQMSYSLKLDTLPVGADPIEYALTESHEGYCMHFASAATLLLRQGGVPARYASGYAVKPSAFKYEQETGIYKAKVDDYMAHAWVEIYLENIGWVPLEVTPGSSLENMPSQDDIDRWETQAEAQRQEHIDSSQSSESEDSEESERTEETEETEDTQQPSESETTPSESEELQNTEDTPNGSEQNNQANPGGIGLGDGELSLDVFMKWFGMIGGSILFIACILYAVRYGIKRYRSELTNEIENSMTRKAINRINRRMYRSVRIRDPKLWFARKMSDIEYEKVLVEQYPDIPEKDWKQFMDIVKKNHYSKETISVEEMLYCYECYKACAWQKKKKVGVGI